MGLAIVKSIFDTNASNNDAEIKIEAKSLFLLIAISVSFVLLLKKIRVKIYCVKTGCKEFMMANLKFSLQSNTNRKYQSTEDTRVMKKISLVLCVLLLLLPFFAISNKTTVKGIDRASLLYGSTAPELQTETETELVSDVCALIEADFSQLEDYVYVENYYGTTQAPIYDNIPYCSENFDMTTVLYKGHTVVDQWGFPVYSNRVIYDDHNYTYLAVDSGVGSQHPQNHNFVFFWTCTTCEYFGYNNCDVWFQFPAAWLQTDDPQCGDKCYIGFVGASKPFEEITGYGSYKYSDFIVSFYDYATQGYSIYDSLYQAAQDNLGSMNHPLFTGYYEYYFDQEWLCYLTWFGDTSITIE
jgi:hypothetical protein